MSIKPHTNTTSLPPLIQSSFTMGKTKLIILDGVEINGSPSRFILDSGAPFLVLNHKYFDSNDSDDQFKGIGGDIAVSGVAEIASFRWNQYRLENCEARVFDLSHIEAHNNIEITGLIGYDLLKDYETEIDFSNKILTLSHNETVSQSCKQDTFVKIPFEMSKHLPVLTIHMGDYQMNIGFDTGASVNLLDKSWEEKLSTSVLNIVEEKQIFGIDGSITKRVYEAPSVSIEDVPYNDMRTIFSDISHINASSDIRIDGIFGYEMFTRYKTAINFQEKVLKVY